MVGANFIQNCSLPINKTIHAVFSIVLITHTICGYTHSNSFMDCFHTNFIIIKKKFPHIVLNNQNV